MKASLLGTTGIRSLGLLFLAIFMMTGLAEAQNQDLTFSLGGIPRQTRDFQGSAGTAQIFADRSLGVNYGHCFLGAKKAALFGEIEFVALPNRPVTSQYNQTRMTSSTTWQVAPICVANRNSSL